MTEPRDGATMRVAPIPPACPQPQRGFIVHRLIVLSVTFALLLGCASVAVARNMKGNGGPDRLTGTPAIDVISGGGGDDVINGAGGNDILLGNGGNDTIKGGPGRDKISGGNGRDVIDVRDRSAKFPDGEPDRVVCGSGRDVVYRDANDVLARDCEVRR